MSDKLHIIYNDTCPICAREVSAYKGMTDEHVTYGGLSEGAHCAIGLDEDTAARSFHVIHAGEVFSGVPAFALLWERMPRLRWLARLVRLPVIAPLAQMVYGYVLAPVLFAMHKRRQRLGKVRRIG